MALAGVALASREHQEGQRRVAAGVGLALLAAVGFGGYFVPMHAAGDADFWWASLIFRSTSFLLVAVTALALRSSVRVSRGDAVFVAAVGLGDMLGNVLFAASSNYGLVSVTSVLASLYPDRHRGPGTLRAPRACRPRAGSGHRRDARRSRAHLGGLVEGPIASSRHHRAAPIAEAPPTLRRRRARRIGDHGHSRRSRESARRAAASRSCARERPALTRRCIVPAIRGVRSRDRRY